MARNLTFSLGGKQYCASPQKIERKKLYGWTETLALDDEGNECKLVSMDESGTLIIPKGGIGLGIVSPDMDWVERGALKAVTLDGEDAVLKKSSYDAPIVLERTVTPEQLLDNSITAFYLIEDADPELIAAVGDAIYTFDYQYRDGYEGSNAFLIGNEGALFMLLGYASAFEMLSLEEAGYIEDADAEEEEEENDDIDFSMF